MSFHVNGNEPDIIGMKCQGFCLIQHQEGESITDQANVAFFKFDESWAKLYFDGNTIFWRGSSAPGVQVNDRLSTCLVLVNLCEFEGVIDHILKSIEYDSGNDYVGAKLTFSGGKTLNFIHHGTDDYTTINC